MGHCIQHFEINGNVSDKQFKNEVLCFLDSYAEYNKRETPDVLYIADEIEKYKNICGCYEEAESYLSNMANKKSYHQCAVRYYEDAKEQSMASKKLYERISSEKKSLEEYKRKNDVRNFVVAYIGCKECGSKLKRELIVNNTCPLCHNDLRSDTIKNTIARKESKIIELNKKYMVQRKHDAEKAKNICWLVRIETHV